MPAVSLKPATSPCGAWYCSTAAEASSLAFTGKGMLHTLLVSNSNAAVRYIWVFDSLTAAGMCIAGPFAVPAVGSAAIVLTQAIPFSTGLTVATSSTQATFTAAAAEMRATVGYAKQAL